MDDKTMAWIDGWIASEDSKRDSLTIKKIYFDINDNNHCDTLIFSRIMFWHGRSLEARKPHSMVYRDGYYWLAKQYKDWWEECRVTESQAKASIKRICGRNLIIKKSYRLDNGLISVHLRINNDELPKAINRLW